MAGNNSDLAIVIKELSPHPEHLNQTSDEYQSRRHRNVVSLLSRHHQSSYVSHTLATMSVSHPAIDQIIQRANHMNFLTVEIYSCLRPISAKFGLPLTTQMGKNLRRRDYFCPVPRGTYRVHIVCTHIPLQTRTVMRILQQLHGRETHSSMQHSSSLQQMCPNTRTIGQLILSIRAL